MPGKRGGNGEQDAGGERRHHPTAQSCLLESHRPPCCQRPALGEITFSLLRRASISRIYFRHLLDPAIKAVFQVGTSAGVIVTLGLPHITATTTKLPSPPPLSGWINAGLGLTDQ